MTSSNRRGRGALRFTQRFLAASALAVTVGFLGFAIEHSALAQVVAPHNNGPERLQVVTRGGQAFAKIEVGSPDHQKVMLLRLPKLVTGIRHGHELVLNPGAGSPSNFSNWAPVAEILVLIVAITLFIAGLDQLRRIAQRRRRAAATAPALRV